MFGIAVLRVGPAIHPWLGHTDRQNEILGAAFGLHLANYFWSGVAKVVIGPMPWTWIFENQTYAQIPYTIESGILPIGHVPWLADLAYRFLEFMVVPLNAAIVAVQLFAVICILRVSWLKITAILYDVLHLGIFIFGGLFFWPWIWNNMTIIWAAKHANGVISWNTKVACIVAVILGMPALKLNEAAWLGWFDVADARQTYFEAVKKDGQTVKVPSAFFLSHSYSISHGAVDRTNADGHYPHTYLASLEHYHRPTVSGACVPPPARALGQLESPETRAARIARLNRFLSAHHGKMLEREKTRGKASFYFRSHHHPSNPFLYRQFNATSLADVVAYNLVRESACHGLRDGAVVKKLLNRSVDRFDVQ